MLLWLISTLGILACRQLRLVLRRGTLVLRPPIEAR